MKTKITLSDIVVVATIVIFVIAVALTFGRVFKKKSQQYGMCAVVINTSRYNDTVTIRDFNGNLWQFKGVEDWGIDDVCACIMDDNGTREIKDDTIVSVRYSGWVSGWK